MSELIVVLHGAANRFRVLEADFGRACRIGASVAARNQRHKPAKETSMIRKAKAVWHGTGRAGNGSLSSDSGVLAGPPYSFKTRFENEKGTNPEELIAAAHAGCFTMALAFGLQGAGFTPTELSTEAAVTLEPEGQGFRISRSALT